MTEDFGRIIWIRVEKPVFDLWGVITSSISFTLLVAAIALVLGGVMGTALILLRRREHNHPSHRAELDLHSPNSIDDLTSRAYPPVPQPSSFTRASSL